MNNVIPILQFVANDVWGILPVFLFSILLSVLINELKLDFLIQRAMTTKVGVAVPLATAVGSFTPFCSCTVIPVITSLLAGGVPLAAVMAFWISSPTMDLEIFAISVNILGWPLAIARLVATLALSIAAGFLTYGLTRWGFMRGQTILRKLPVTSTASCCGAPVQVTLQATAPASEQLIMPTRKTGTPLAVLERPVLAVAETSSCCGTVVAPVQESCGCGTVAEPVQESCGCGTVAVPVQESCGCGTTVAPVQESCGCSTTAAPAKASSCCGADKAINPDEVYAKQEERWWVPVMRNARALQWRRVLINTLDQSWRLGALLVGAFFLEALITFYVPTDVVTRLFGGNSPFAIPLATLIGIPVYVNTVSAWPIIAGLLAHGMRPGAAVAFLIAGPITTLPALLAVWQVVRWQVFALYFGMGIVGAILAGYVTTIFLH